MSLNPAKCRVEIFRKPGFFDDSFAKGWTKTSGGTSSFSTDGDIASLNKGDQASCDITKSFSTLSTDTYTKLQIRVTAISESLIVYVWDGTTWIAVVTITVTGVSEVSLPSAKNITDISLNGFGTTSIDYVSICKNPVLIPDLGDLVEELTV